MSQTYHILNGDALLSFFPESILNGKIIVARECLVDGPLAGNTLEDFWQTRADFIAAEYGEDRQFYFDDVVPEFNQISLVKPDSEVNLWFEEDLFCQVNLWFCISLLKLNADKLKINWMKPPLKNGQPDWGGFGSLDRNGLAEAYQARQRLSEFEIQLMNDLWNAFKNNNDAELKILSEKDTIHFPFLNAVVQAHLERYSPDNLSGRPERVLREIMTEKVTTDFSIIFREWSRREGIYGFGDSQVESILKKLPEFNKQ